MKISSKKAVSILAASIVCVSSTFAFFNDVIVKAGSPTPSISVNPTYISDRYDNKVNTYTIKGSGFTTPSTLTLYQCGELVGTVKVENDGSITTKCSVYNYENNVIKFELRDNKSIIADGASLYIEPVVVTDQNVSTINKTVTNNFTTTITKETTVTSNKILTELKTITVNEGTTSTVKETVVSTTTVLSNVTVPETTITNVSTITEKGTTVTTTEVQTKHDGLQVIYVVIIGVAALGLGLLIMNIIFRAKYY